MISHAYERFGPFFRALVRVFLILGCVVQSPSLSAAIPFTSVIVKVLDWVGGHIFGKVVLDRMGLSDSDRSTGEDLERQLTRLLDQLRHSPKGDRDQLQQQLALTQSELQSVREILHSKLGPEDIERLRARFKEDFSRISLILTRHEERLGYLDSSLKAVQRRLQELEKKLLMRPEGTAPALRIGGYLVRILKFGAPNSAVPRSLHVAAPELLASKLSHDAVGNIRMESDELSELLISGALIRYLVERRPYSGYGIRTLSRLHTLQMSVQLLNAEGTQTYLAKSYERQKKETSLDGRHHKESDDVIAHELLGEVLDTVAGDILEFLHAPALGTETGPYD